MDLPDTYQEHVLNAPDVCSNCFALVREARQDYLPEQAHNGPTLELDTVSRPSDGKTFVETSYYGAREETTTEAYDPHSPPTDARDYYCECGTASSYDRHWDDRDINRDRFREMIKQLVRALRTKQVSVRGRQLAAYALHEFDKRSPVPAVGPRRPDQPVTVDEALAAGLSAAITTQAASSSAVAD